MNIESHHIHIPYHSHYPLYSIYLIFPLRNVTVRGWPVFVLWDFISLQEWQPQWEITGRWLRCRNQWMIQHLLPPPPPLGYPYIITKTSVILNQTQEEEFNKRKSILLLQFPISTILSFCSTNIAVNKLIWFEGTSPLHCKCWPAVWWGGGEERVYY